MVDFRSHRPRGRRPDSLLSWLLPPVALILLSFAATVCEHLLRALAVR